MLWNDNLVSVDNTGQDHRHVGARYDGDAELVEEDLHHGRVEPLPEDPQSRTFALPSDEGPLYA